MVRSHSRLPDSFLYTGWHSGSKARPPEFSCVRSRDAADGRAGRRRADACAAGTARRRRRHVLHRGSAADAEARPGDAELAVWALESWQRAAGGTLTFVRAASEDEALVRLYWAPAAGGQYGEMRPLESMAAAARPSTSGPTPRRLGDEIAARARLDASVSRHDRLSHVPARARPCSGARAYRRVRRTSCTSSASAATSTSSSAATAAR